MLRVHIERPQIGPSSLVPVIDGLALTELVGTFERESGYCPAGGYAGIFPELFPFGDLAAYLTGRDNAEWPRPGTVWLLGCECGVVDCWPLEARVTTEGKTVRWDGFRQPHRPEWNYSGFGPFTFDAQEYRSAVQAAVELLAATETREG